MTPQARRWTAGLLAAGASIACSKEPAPLGVSQDRAALIAALGTDRPTEGRLCGLPFAPWQLAATAPAFDRDVAVRTRSIESTTASGSPGNVADLAFVRLVARRPAEAVSLFEKRRTTDELGAAELSDLGAAYLARGANENLPGDFIAALDTLERAVELAPRLPEARFNLALALEKNLLRDQAIAAWKDYLAIDIDDAWRQEGRRMLSRLSAPRRADGWAGASPALQRFPVPADTLDRLLREFPDRVRKTAEEELVTRWARQLASGQAAAAASTIELLRQIGQGLGSKLGEWMVLDTVTSLERLNGADLEKAADDLALLASGHQACLSSEGATGAELIRRARRGLGNSEIAVARWADLYLAICLYHRSEFASAISLLAAVRSRDNAARYPSLTARSLWMTGLVLSSQGDPSRALRAYGEGSRIFRRAGSQEDAAGLELLTAETLRFVGLRQDALALLYRGAIVAIDAHDGRRTYTALDDLRQAALDLDRPRAASRFADQLVALAAEFPDPAGTTYALVRRGETRLSLGRVRDALLDFTQAEAHSHGIADVRARQRRLVDILLARARARAVSDPRAAGNDLAAAAGILRHLGDAYRLIEAYAARAQILTRLANHRAADHQLQAAMTEYERQRHNIDTAEQRVEFTNRLNGIFDQILASASRSGTAEERQLEIADAASGRLLEAMAAHSASAPESKPSTPELLRRLPSDVTVVEYAVLEDRVKIWLLRDGQLQTAASQIDESDLERLLGAVNREVMSQHPSPNLPVYMRRLYTILIGPIEDVLTPTSPMVIVPSKHLLTVPFAALRAGDGRYLAETRSISIAPSAAFYVRHPVVGRRLSVDSRVLILANPAFDRYLLPSLARLPGADEEALWVSQLYGPRASRKAGSEATPAALLDGLHRYEILHVATHASSNDERPLLSSLVLSPDSGSLGLLYARDIAHTSATATRLAILTACRTASGGTPGSGSRGLVEAFLAAGVPQVVGTLWDLDDRAARAFALAFHRRLLGGMPASKALQETQIAMLGSPDPAVSRVAAWAGYELFGAHVN